MSADEVKPFEIKLSNTLKELFQRMAEAGEESVTLDFEFPSGMQVGYRVELIRAIDADGVVQKDEIVSVRLQ